jgi:hypothetical protein
MIVLATLLCLAAFVRVWHRTTRSKTSAAAGVFDAGMLCWGVAYALNAIQDPNTAGRLAVLNLFGSIPPVPSLIEDVAIILLVLTAGVAIGPTLKGPWLNAGVVVGSLVFAALAGETFVRVRVAIAPTVQGVATNSGLAWVRRYATPNRDGFRDRDHDLVAAPGTRRLLVVGDSFALGLGIRRPDDRMGEQLAGLLAARTGYRWEPINAALVDRNTIDEIGFLNRTLVYKPDVVVLIYVFNDMNYLTPEFHEALIHRPSVLSPTHLAFANSYLFQELYVRLRRFGSAFKKSIADDPYKDDAMLARHLGDVARFTTLAAEHGAVVTVVPFDNLIGVEPHFRDRYRRFVDHATARGIPVCSLDKTFPDRPTESLTVNALDGHPNELANHRAAATVVDCLVPR